MENLPPPPLPLHEIALLLDVDGTLLDIAARPSEVVVPPPLTEALTRLRDRTAGALALVSGRPLADIDRIFAPSRLAAIGGHGAEVRPSPAGPVFCEEGAKLPAGLKQALADAARAIPGILIEDKDASIALHYRQTPRQEAALSDAVNAIVTRQRAGTIEVLRGKAVIEIKPAGFNKGSGVRRLMAHPPFAGRKPVFAGDDVTDETAIAVIPEFNGLAISVGRRIDGADYCFAKPSDLRRWLTRLATGTEPR
jgi:trehalose 6-phosphate phosphatase